LSQIINSGEEAKQLEPIAERTERSGINSNLGSALQMTGKKKRRVTQEPILTELLGEEEEAKKVELEEESDDAP
jgi:hypothetical protein